MGYFNIYGQYVQDDAEFYHHGILGQKKGVRNGPPYPLGSGDHSASEEKAGWRQSLNSAKDDYKKKKQAYKKAKLDYKAGRVTTATERWMLKKAKRSKEGAKEALQQIRDAGGDKRLESAAKADIKYFTRAYKEAKARLSAQKASKPVLKMTLEQAKQEFDLAKEKLKVEKQLAGVDFKSRVQRLFDAVRGKDTPEKIANSIKNNPKARNKVLENNEDLRKAYYDIDDAVEVDLKAWEKKHKREFDGDGGEFYEKMLKDPNSNTYKAKKKWNDMVDEYAERSSTDYNSKRSSKILDTIKSKLNRQEEYVSPWKETDEANLERALKAMEKTRPFNDSRERALTKDLIRADSDFNEMIEFTPDDRKYRDSIQRQIDDADARYVKAKAELKKYYQEHNKGKNAVSTSKVRALHSSGLSYKEIAKRMNISESYVSALLSNR